MEVYSHDTKRIKNLQDYFLALHQKYKYFCIFGGGIIAGTWLEWFYKNEIAVEYLCDNKLEAVPAHFHQYGIQFITFAELEQIKKDTLVIVGVSNGRVNICDQINRQLDEFPHVIHNSAWFEVHIMLEDMYDENTFRDKVNKFRMNLCDDVSKEILDEIVDLSILTEDKIWSENNPLDRFYNPNQYFTDDLVTLSPNEAIVDCGAYNGDSLDDFVNRVSSFDRYYCLEMNAKNREDLYKRIQQYSKPLQKKIQVFPYGVWSKHDILNCSGNDVTSYNGLIN